MRNHRQAVAHHGNIDSGHLGPFCRRNFSVFINDNYLRLAAINRKGDPQTVSRHQWLCRYKMKIRGEIACVIYKELVFKTRRFGRQIRKRFCQVWKNRDRIACFPEAFDHFPTITALVGFLPKILSSWAMRRHFKGDQRQLVPFYAPTDILRILTDRLERSNGAVVDHR